MIHIEELYKSYGDTHALAGVNLEVGAGEVVGLVGPSGAGKSTLLRALNRFVVPSSGRVEVDGRDVASLRGQALRDHRTSVGMVYQRFHLVGRLSALDNATSGAVSRTNSVRTLLGLLPAIERRRAFEALDRVGMAARWDQRADTLSGGQQQRVAIARTLVQDPTVVLADEPVASLDPGASERVLGLLASLAKEDGRTVVVSLHQVEYARRFCDRIVALDGGVVTIDAAPHEIPDGDWERLYQTVASDPENEAELAGTALVR